MYQYPARLVSNVMKTKSRKTQVVIPVHLTWEDKQGENGFGVQMFDLLRILFCESNYDQFRCFHLIIAYFDLLGVTYVPQGPGSG